MKIERRKPLRLSSEFSTNCHPVLATIYSQRLLESADHIEYKLKHLSPANCLSGLTSAVERLTKAIEKQERILIVGDFDADGATSTAVCLLLLKSLGAQHVDYLVPNRFDFGYGLSAELVDVTLDSASRITKPDVIITVDNGISSIAGVNRANELDIDVIITDHHLPGRELPEAYAIVNPNVDGDAFPSKHLAGVGVAFYLMAALTTHFKQSVSSGAYDSVKPVDYLDLVALGTVADVVRLDYNNRILVAQGIARIKASRCRPGITALLQVAGRDPAKITASDLGFAVGPRLNAAGRIDDISIGIECLLADDLPTALPLARQLDDLNRERRAMQADMEAEALALLDELAAEPDASNSSVNDFQPNDSSNAADMMSYNFGVTVYQSNWHAGVVGLVAGKIKEKLHRPVIAFAQENPETLKGSARSIPGVHIRDVLEYVSTQNPGLISKFGGHAMAAGLSLPKAHLNEFKQAFDQAVQARVQPEQLQAIVYTDGGLNTEALTMDTAQAIKSAGPWGQGFPEPLFDDVFIIRQVRIVGEKHIKLKIQHLAEFNGMREKGSAKDFYEAIWFFAPEEYLVELPKMNSHWQMAYKLDVNHYMGSATLQLIIETMLPQ